MSATGLRFSVIIPVYNGAAFIARAIESCLQQTKLPEEIIVIDDASTDDTAAIIQALHSPLVKYIRNERNSGPSFTRNNGIRLAAGDWILFLDADDVFHPEKIAIIDNCIQIQNSIKAIGHSFEVIGKEYKKIDNNHPAVRMISSREVLLKNPVVTPALCVSASNNIFFNEEMSYAEDHDFILRTTEQHGLAFIDLPLCSLQRLPLTAGGISSNKWRMRKGEMKMYINYCKRHNVYRAMPFLLLFSLLKHVRQLVVTKKAVVAY